MTPKYILTHLTGNWAHFSVEDPNCLGYPAGAPGTIVEAEVKVGFSGTWARTFTSRETTRNSRAFAKGREGLTELWLEGKEWTGGPCDVQHNLVQIHAGCPLPEFVSLIHQGGGEVFLDEATRKLLQPRLYQVEEGILPPDSLEALESGRPVALLEVK